MSYASGPVEVLPVGQAREEFSQVVRRFRAEGLSSRPVVFGSHRKPEAVTIPYELFVALLPAIEDVLLAEIVRERQGQDQIEWGEALDAAGVSPDDVAAVCLDDYVIEGE